MFFETPSIGCHETTCNVTKVTYYMYSCDTCCMSREMMEMDGLDSAKCQKSRRRDVMRIMGIVNEEKIKDEHRSSSSIKRPKKCEWLEKRDVVGAENGVL